MFEHKDFSFFLLFVPKFLIQFYKVTRGISFPSILYMKSRDIKYVIAKVSDRGYFALYLYSRCMSFSDCCQIESLLT